MNIVLSALNAAALVALVTLHFQGDGTQTESLAAQTQPHHLLRQAPQLAIMTEQSRDSAVLTNQSDEPVQATSSEPRWVF